MKKEKQNYGTHSSSPDVGVPVSNPVEETDNKKGLDTPTTVADVSAANAPQAKIRCELLRARPILSPLSLIPPFFDGVNSAFLGFSQFLTVIGISQGSLGAKKYSWLFTFSAIAGMSVFGLGVRKNVKFLSKTEKKDETNASSRSSSCFNKEKWAQLLKKTFAKARESPHLTLMMLLGAVTEWVINYTNSYVVVDDFIREDDFNATVRTLLNITLGVSATLGAC